MANVPPKRKKPPTFQHYPKKRAKTLKAQWVEKTKIKSKWKAQKRKEGLLTRRIPSNDKMVDSERNEEEDDERNPSQPSDVISDVSSNEHDEVNEPDLEPARVVPEQNRPGGGPSASRRLKNVPYKHPDRAKRLPGKAEGQPERPPTLRDRAREAYSSTTLHTYRSTSFQKGGRGRGGSAGTRGRGQPNMKLRMGVMLEKIKEKYS